MKLSKVTDNREIKKYIGLLYSELFDPKAVPSEGVFENIFSQLKDPKVKHDAYCLKQGGDTVAFFTLGESFSIFAHGKYGIINELWVSEKFRSKGVGKVVIEEISKIGSERNWSRIDVSAPPDEKWDRTFEFYKKNGFTFTGRKLKVCL